MARERKVRCDCGGEFLEKKVQYKGLSVPAMVCEKCGHTNLTWKQADYYMKLSRLHSILGRTRKIIKVGNSMGMLLPEKLREFGIKPGKKVRIDLIDRKSFKVEMF